MKKLILILFVLFIIFSGCIFYKYKYLDELKKLEYEEEKITINELYIYGTHLNMKGLLNDNKDYDLVLYDGEFIEVNINTFDNTFNLSNTYNRGLYLEDIPRGEYYLFLRNKETDDKGEILYKYYTLNNNTNYKETIYYTFNDINNKITIDSNGEYPTIRMIVKENKDKDIYDIVIDPGHGGKDNGAVRNGYMETDFTMKLANLVKDKLEENGFKVKLTHEEGQLAKNEKLAEYGENGRAVIPREVKAKYLFSLHINSSNSSSVNGLEVYTAKNINYDLANLLVKNITTETGLTISNNKINKLYDGIYVRNFTEENIESSRKDMEDKDKTPYNITTNSNYYYIIRETGGIITGAYVDGRNDDIPANPYYNSNVGTEAYLLELGYISNKNDLDKLINNLDKYKEGIVNSVLSLKTKSVK